MVGRLGEGAGCVGVAVTVLVIVLVVGIGVVVPAVWGDLADSKAEELRAQAALELARMEREHQQSVDWVREFEVYAVTLATVVESHVGLVAVLAGMLGAVCGGVVIGWLQRAEIW